MYQWGAHQSHLHSFLKRGEFPRPGQTGILTINEKIRSWARFCTPLLGPARGLATTVASHIGPRQRAARCPVCSRRVGGRWVNRPGLTEESMGDCKISLSIFLVSIWLQDCPLKHVSYFGSPCSITKKVSRVVIHDVMHQLTINTDLGSGWCKQ